MSRAGAPPIVLAFATDQGFAMPTAVAMRSALDTIAPMRPVEVHVIGIDLQDATWRQLRASSTRAGTTFTAIHGDPSRFIDLPDSRIITRTAYWRLLLPELLPDHSRVIYLDSDVLVRRDIAELFDLDLQGDSTAGVRDYEMWYASSNGGIPGNPALAAFVPYINSGVLLMSLDAWRVNRVAARAEAYRRATPDAREVDQDAVNVAIAGEVRLLDPRWNVQTPAFLSRWRSWPGWPLPAQPGQPPTPFPMATVEQVRRDPWIVHFTTDRKPWTHGCGNRMQAEWLDVYAWTAWGGERLSRPIRPRTWLRRCRQNAAATHRYFQRRSGT
jgi:lipopolysaccharide biosynthesis glycosyltransferase